MPDLNDVNIKELLAKSDTELRAALEAMLPKPTYPEHMLGLWAKHPEHGDVLLVSDCPYTNGDVNVAFSSEKYPDGADVKTVHVSELTFPEQTTRPEDVPGGEAWLVNVDNGERSAERVVALKDSFDYWCTGGGAVKGGYGWADNEVTLIAPLVPAQPEPESEPEHPATLMTVEEYENAPSGAVVAEPGFPAWTKDYNGDWCEGGTWFTDRKMAGTERQVLRWGWGK